MREIRREEQTNSTSKLYRFTNICLHAYPVHILTQTQPLQIILYHCALSPTHTQTHTLKYPHALTRTPTDLYLPPSQISFPQSQPKLSSPIEAEVSSGSTAKKKKVESSPFQPTSFLIEPKLASIGLLG